MLLQKQKTAVPYDTFSFMQTEDLNEEKKSWWEDSRVHMNMD